MNKELISNSISLGFTSNSELTNKITQLSTDYWNYKGYYDFPPEFKGLNVK